MARLPALEVDAAHDQRQLCAEIDRLLDGETVPQLMQDGPQHAVGLVLIGKIAVVAQLLEPFLHQLHGMADGGLKGHGCSSFAGSRSMLTGVAQL
jgi:hypothetical protein